MLSQKEVTNTCHNIILPANLRCLVLCLVYCTLDFDSVFTRRPTGGSRELACFSTSSHLRPDRQRLPTHPAPPVPYPAREGPSAEPETSILPSCTQRRGARLVGVVPSLSFVHHQTQSGARAPRFPELSLFSLTVIQYYHFQPPLEWLHLFPASASSSIRAPNSVTVCDRPPARPSPQRR